MSSNCKNYNIVYSMKKKMTQHSLCTIFPTVEQFLAITELNTK